MKATTCVLLLAVLVPGVSASEDPDEQARQIEQMLVAPRCWTQPVSEHDSGTANEIRTGVRQMLADGKSRREILDFYVAEYGQRILVTHAFRGFNVTAYGLPALFLAAGGWLTFSLIRRWYRRGQETGFQPPSLVVERGYLERMERERYEGERIVARYKSACGRNA